MSSFCTSSTTFKKFNAGNVILFQIKVFGGNIKETTLTRNFITVTERLSFIKSQ